ncbi:MFS transporter [Chloroflexota bacterium]
MILRKIHFGWVIILITTLITIVFSVLMSTRGIFLSSLIDWFGWDRGDISSAYSASFVISGLLALFSGRLTDRFGPRIMVTLLGLLVGTGLILMSMVTSIIHVYLIWVLLIGVGVSCGIIPILSTIPKWFNKKRGLAFGITLAGFGFGGIIWPPIMDHLITNVGWQLSYVFAGILVLVIIPVLAQLIRQDPQKMGLQPYGATGEITPIPEIYNSTITGFTLIQALKMPPYWLISLSRFCSMFIIQLMMVHIFPHAVDIGFQEITAAFIISIMSTATVISRLFTGFIADKMGYRLTLFVSANVLIISLVILNYFREPSWLYYVFALLVGSVWGASDILMTNLSTMYFGLRSIGTILGSMELFLTAGGALGVAIAGIIFDRTGSYSIPFLICLIQAVLFMLFSVLLIRSRNTKIIY